MIRHDELPNILIFFLDELRADALGCYGHPFVQTPNIDNIVKEGVFFSQAFSNSPVCVPARNCFYTGLYPSEHGLLNNDGSAYAIANRKPCAFGEVLKAAGYERIINIGKHHTKFSPEDSGYTEYYQTPDKRGATPRRAPQGADLEKDPYVVSPLGPVRVILGGTYPGTGEDTHAHQTVDKALELLADMGDEPWVLNVNMNSPHTPVLAPEPFASMYLEQVKKWTPTPDAGRTQVMNEWIAHRGFALLSLEEQRKARASYYGLVSYVDHQIGRVEEYFRKEGSSRSLLTIVVSDHGSSVGDHGCQVKGPYASSDIAHIPLIIRWSGKVAPKQYHHLVQITDITPTLAALLEVQAPYLMSGRSLAAVIMGEKEGPIHDQLFFEENHHYLYEAVRTPEYLYVRYPERQEWELFDLVRDPGETRNVFASNQPVAEELDKALDRFRTEHPLDPSMFS